MTSLTPEIKEQFQAIKLLVMDVDGVLTDGGVYVLEDGREFRRFNIKDGQGIKLLTVQGIQIVVITSSECPSVLYRMQKLDVREVHYGVENKLSKLIQICDRLGINLDEVCYLGDDLADLEVMGAVGLPCAPTDAAREVRLLAGYVTQARGGHGAVREVCDLITSGH